MSESAAKDRSLLAQEQASHAEQLTALQETSDQSKEKGDTLRKQLEKAEENANKYREQTSSLNNQVAELRAEKQTVLAKARSVTPSRLVPVSAPLRQGSPTLPESKGRGRQATSTLAEPSATMMVHSDVDMTEDSGVVDLGENSNLTLDYDDMNHSNPRCCCW